MDTAKFSGDISNSEPKTGEFKPAHFGNKIDPIQKHISNLDPAFVQKIRDNSRELAGFLTDPKSDIGDIRRASERDSAYARLIGEKLGITDVETIAAINKRILEGE